MKLHLVDGTYELFRAFYGRGGEGIAPDGRDVGATRGLLRSLLALLRQDDVTHVGVAFDHVIESFRNDLWPGYKTGDGIDPALAGQFELAERACAALGVVVWPMIEFEADDALATAAVRFAGEVDQVVICSPDKDLTQCVRGDRIVCLDRMRGNLLDEPRVKEKFGVGPGSIADWLALVGDSADGYPGLPRWGAKSAATVLARWERIENIPDDHGRWEVAVRGADGLAKCLREQRQDAMLFKRLATLREDAPVREDLDGMRWRGARRDELRALCDELGDRDFFERVPRWQ